MKVIIKETQQAKELTIKSSDGIDWTADLLGMHDALEYDDNQNCTMSQHDYDWWQQYIDNKKSDAKDIADLAQKLGIDEWEILEIIQKETYDLDDEHKITQSVLENFRKNL